MARVAVVTDSCASIPEPMLHELKIHWAAYYIHRGKEILRDLVTIQREEFIHWLLTARTLPTTACPSPNDYLDLYERAASEGAQEIISIHITAKASGAYQSACIAQAMALEKLPGVRIEVVDTQNVSLCQGWMVIEAARAAQAGKKLDEILSLVKGMIPITRMLQTADTLRYLYMGGRIGRAQHLMGTLLKIKPIIGMENGIIQALGKARSRLGAYQMMADMVENAAGFRGKIKIAYVHAGALAEVEKIRSLIEARMTCVESLIAELAPSLAVHSGPGTAGLCFFPVEQSTAR